MESHLRPQRGDQNGLAVNSRDKEAIDLGIKNARKDLESLRQGTIPYDRYKWDLGRICDAVSRGIFSFADIGTSKKEIEELRIKGCQIAACGRLEHLRRGAALRSTFVDLIRREVQEGNLSLADIGTSEKELTSFLR